MKPFRVAAHQFLLCVCGTMAQPFPWRGCAPGGQACFSSPRGILRAICLFSDVFWLELRLLLSKMKFTNCSQLRNYWHGLAEDRVGHMLLEAK
jgi:hypothetical protein